MLLGTLAALRVLMVLPFPPHAEGGAAARCAIGLLRGLQAHGIECQAVGAHARPTPPPDPPEDLSVEVVRFPYPSPLHKRWVRLVAPHTDLASSPFAARVRELAREADVVHCVELEGAALIPHVTRPAVAQIHCLTRRDRDVRGPWTREGRIGIELLRAERRVFRRARWLLANSEEVAGGFAPAAPRAHVAVAPLTLDPAQYAARAALERSVAGLIGTARWPPTANAVERLLTQIWPRVLERRPDARLLLAGHGMEPATFPHLRTDLPGVEWRGGVASATDFLHELGILLYPLGRGSGAKVKVLEALALGLPVVTTPDGAEGIVGGDGMVVESDDEPIAAAAATLLGDVAARRAAGAQAYRTFAEHHAPAVAAKPVIELYERMLRAGSTDGGRSGSG
jgi:glycosyltransferase involved in cell wall biosynthesis